MNKWFHLFLEYILTDNLSRYCGERVLTRSVFSTLRCHKNGSFDKYVVFYTLDYSIFI